MDRNFVPLPQVNSKAVGNRKFHYSINSKTYINLLGLYNWLLENIPISLQRLS